MNPPDLFHRPDGWYRSEYELQFGPKPNNLCFAIKNRQLMARDFESDLTEILAGMKKPYSDLYTRPADFVPLGALTYICSLDGRPHKNEWEDDLELE